MTAIRCCCARCAGSVTYARVGDYLEAHQLADGEYVLDGEVELLGSRDRHPSGGRVQVATFSDGSQVMIATNGDVMTAATRGAPWETWGPPAELDEAP
jgi:hypothetical protein